ncbi:MAG: hypothetical protein QQN57_04735 [Nitrosopumilus sp.]
MYKCDFCGSAFGDRICYFCEKNCCTSCMTDDRTLVRIAIFTNEDWGGRN